MVSFSFVFHIWEIFFVSGISSSLESPKNGHFWRGPFPKKPLFPIPITAIEFPEKTNVLLRHSSFDALPDSSSEWTCMFQYCGFGVFEELGVWRIRLAQLRVPILDFCMASHYLEQFDAIWPPIPPEGSWVKNGFAKSSGSGPQDVPWYLSLKGVWVVPSCQASPLP